MGHFPILFLQRFHLFIICRAERNEMPAQQTLGTLSKRQQAQQRSGVATPTTAAPAVDAAALKWVCSYSFKYRDSPAGSLSFSRDGSLLAVAHRNLLTLWDPVK